MPPKARGKQKDKAAGGPSKVASIAGRAIDDLRLSRPVALALKDIQAELADAYRDRFIEMLDMLRQQGSTLARLQETLHVLVREVAPALAGTTPAALRVAAEGTSPDLASTLVVADPIAAGYTLTQADLTKALGLPNSADISVLVRALDINKDADCAVVVRQGRRFKMVNYHPRAVQILRRLIEEPPSGTMFKAAEQAALKRVRRKLLPSAG